jgi:Na+/H+-dicarboxylate symporter
MVVLWTLLLAAGYGVPGKSVFALVWLIRQPMAIAFWTASGEAAYPQTTAQLTRFGIKPGVNNYFVLPLTYSFNLDGSMMYQAFATLFVARSFARVVEIVLKDSELKDGLGYCPEPALWAYAVQHCGYVQSRHATGRVLIAAA